MVDDTVLPVSGNDGSTQADLMQGCETVFRSFRAVGFHVQAACLQQPQATDWDVNNHPIAGLSGNSNPMYFVQQCMLLGLCHLDRMGISFSPFLVASKEDF